MAGRIVIGTAGWSQPDGGNGWYPPGVPARDRLRWYAERFDGVEVDSTFYAVPAGRTVERWASVTPPHFTFDVKLHRLLSRHAAPLSSLPRDLRERAQLTGRGRVNLDERLERELCERILEVMAPLRAQGRLSSFLLQLTPAFKPGAHRLEELEALVHALGPTPVAIELRHRGWARDLEGTLAWFRGVGAAFVCVDAPTVPAPHVLPPVDAATRGDVAYLRAHGRNAEGYLRGRTAAERFTWRYSDEELNEIAARADRLASAAAHVRLMFANGSCAMAAAQRLRVLLGQTTLRAAESDAAGASRRG